MPVVSAIKRQVRARSVRFQVFLDGAYAFTLSDLELSKSGLRVGDSLNEVDVREFEAEAQESQAYAWALRFLGVRMRSRREVLDYLVVRKGCERVEAEAVVGRLEEAGLVNDAAFAQAWVADRLALRPRSRLRLSQELAAKGVASGVIAEALQDLEAGQELDTLVRLMRRKQQQRGYEDTRKLEAYFQRQGYSWGLIKQAREALEGTSY